MTWEGLSALPAPAAAFGAWVLENAMREHVTTGDVAVQVKKLFDAVSHVGGVMP